MWKEGEEGVWCEGEGRRCGVKGRGVWCVGKGRRGCGVKGRGGGEICDDV